jgi:hypothetical protein
MAGTLSRLLLVTALLSGCSGGEDQNQQRGAASAREQGTAEASDYWPGRAPPAGASASLVGLYEGGSETQPNRLCIVPQPEGMRFGLVVWGSNMHSCSGVGSATREGDTLRLAMAGDETCTIEARMSGTTVTLPAAVPDGCAYYCGARASMTGATFAQKGNTIAAAAEARDLVGETLCGAGSAGG